MLRDVMNSYRSWRRQALTRREVARLDPRLRADIVIAPHHGSNTSSSPGFIAAVVT